MSEGKELDKKPEATKFQISNINPEPIGLFSLPIPKHLEYKKIIWSTWNSSTSKTKQKSSELKEHLCNASNQNLFNSFTQLSKLKEDIMNYLITYIKQIGYECDEITINSAWLNNSQKGSTLDFHFHSNSFVSANYFVDFSSATHSQLCFMNDRCFKGRAPAYPTFVIPQSEKKTIYTADAISLNAKEGQIAIWRSHLSHGYTTPNNSGNRLTLSLNAMPTKLDNGKYSINIKKSQ